MSTSDFHHDNIPIPIEQKPHVSILQPFWGGGGYKPVLQKIVSGGLWKCSLAWFSSIAILTN